MACWPSSGGLLYNTEPSMTFAKKLLAGTGLITAAGAGARVLSLLSVPVLSRLLGPESYGVAALAGNVISLAGIAGLRGIDMAYARFYLQGSCPDSNQVENYCWRHACLGAGIAATIAAAGWLLMGARWIPARHLETAGYVATATILLVLTTMATTRVRLAGNYFLLAVSVVTSAFLTIAVNLGLAFAGVRNEWALYSGMLAGSVATLVMLKMPGFLSLIRPSGLEARSRQAVYRLGISGCVTAPMYWIITSSDRWFLLTSTSTETVGIYSVVTNLVSVGMLLNNALTLTWFPESSRLYAQRDPNTLETLGRLASQLIVVLALVWVAMCASGGSLIRILTAPAFHGGAHLIPWLAGGIFFYGVSALATTAFFLEQRMFTVAVVWVFGAGFSLFMNAMLVPVYGTTGAAVAQCLGFASIAALIVLASYRVLPLPVLRRRLCACLLVALITGLVTSQPWVSSPTWDLVAKFPVGALTATLVVYLIAPEWLRRARYQALLIYQKPDG